MLSCKQVATLASQYLDQETPTPLKWKIRMHLMMCANCRRFMRHLKITQTMAKDIDITNSEADTEKVWQALQQKIKQDSRQD
ncbi:zf-HC2 domain-containing protein [Cellvibrio sp. NN19]|uniref:zf-HC2 domain-containing protein n=1 Tax=Cellvibrio chitinivorans TaxID=3102792 RepID=UPI002B407086|nr:zf-HC2 domain-containing protein [Cellvibrio sp. NN19]